MDPELIADCVHCGFCLPSCPTYVLWHEEMDSPRGRIHLMGALADGSLQLTDTVAEHFDRCLGCMACMTACPSGVSAREVGRTLRVLIEEPGVARSEADAPDIDGRVYVDRELPVGEFSNVTITRSRDYDLLALPDGEEPAELKTAKMAS